MIHYMESVPGNTYSSQLSEIYKKNSMNLNPKAFNICMHAIQYSK